MPYDYETAKKAGVPDEEIISHLSEKLGYQLDKAKAAGVGDQEILKELLGRANGPELPTPLAKPLLDMPAISTKSPLGEKLATAGKNLAVDFAEHHLRPIAIVASMSPAGLVAQTWINTTQKLRGKPALTLYSDFLLHGLEANQKTEKTPQAAYAKTIRSNLADLGIGIFDVATPAVAGPAAASIRGVAAKVGLKGALARIASGGVEGAGYGGTAELLHAAIEGNSIGHIANKTTKGLTYGAAGGAILGGAAAVVNRFTTLRQMAQHEAESAQRFSQEANNLEQASALVRQKAPHLDPESQRIATEHMLNGMSPEDAITEAGNSFHAKTRPEMPKPTKAMPSTTNPDPLELRFDETLATGHLPPPGTIEQRGRTVSRFSPSVFRKPTSEIEQRATHLPYGGTKSLQEIVRAKGPRKATFHERLIEARNTAYGFFTAEPGATPGVKEAFLAARQVHKTAQERTNEMISERVGSVLQGARKFNRERIGEGSALLSDYLTSLNKLATIKSLSAERGFPVSGPKRTTQADWEQEVSLLSNKVMEQPEVLQAARAVRNLFNEVHNEMVRRGYIPAGQFREDYLPMERVFQVADVLADFTPETVAGQRLTSMMKRNTAQEYTKTNVIELLQHSMNALQQKIAKDDLFLLLRNDPEVNFTHLFKPGDKIPREYGLVRPGVGMPGVAKNGVEEAFNGVVNGLGLREDVYAPGNYVFKRDVVNRLERFYPKATAREQSLYALSTRYARYLTVYNPGNLVLNAVSDTPLAIVTQAVKTPETLPGFFRFYPTAVKASFRGAFGKESPIYERAVREGVAGSSFIFSVGGEAAPLNLEAMLSEGAPISMRPFHAVGETLGRLRQAVEATPRIAAGLAAEAKGGNFAKVGQEITLHFGAGDPAMSREPIMRLLAPFWKWTGLATERVYQLAATGTPAQKARALAAMTAPAVAAATWNIQNEKFRKIEYSLPEYDRNHAHVIFQDPKTGDPLQDKAGRPVVWKFRVWVPEEIATFWGLGNLPGRALDLASGYTTPGEFAGETLRGMGQNIASLPAAITTATQGLTGRSSLTGQQLETVERLEGTLPTVRLASKVVEAGKNQGAVEALKTIPKELLGVRAAGVKKGMADAKVLSLKQQIGDAEARMRGAASRGNQAQVERFRNKIKALSARIQRLQAVRAEGGQ